MATVVTIQLFGQYFASNDESFSNFEKFPDISFFLAGMSISVYRNSWWIFVIAGVFNSIESKSFSTSMHIPTKW